MPLRGNLKAGMFPSVDTVYFVPATRYIESLNTLKRTYSTASLCEVCPYSIIIYYRFSTIWNEVKKVKVPGVSCNTACLTPLLQKFSGAVPLTLFPWKSGNSTLYHIIVSTFVRKCKTEGGRTGLAGGRTVRPKGRLFLAEGTAQSCPADST
jgi:hypothetical protein